MIGGWRWVAHARRRHYFQGDPGRYATSLCGQHQAQLNGMEQQDPGAEDCAICTAKLTKGDRTLLPYGTD